MMIGVAISKLSTKLQEQPVRIGNKINKLIKHISISQET
jgi:hypothetical protein